MEISKEKPEEPAKVIKKTEEEWKKLLTPEQYRVARQGGTERPNGDVYKQFKKQGGGTYYCVCCGAELFTSKEKFDARCGWPAFYDASKHKNIKTVVDLSQGMKRVEVKCAKCDAHLGHVFEGEGFNTPTDKRYCINGVTLRFVPFVEGKEKGKEQNEKGNNDQKAQVLEKRRKSN